MKRKKGRKKGNIPQVTRFPLPFPRPRVYTLCPCCLLLSRNWRGWNSDTPATAQQQHSYLHDTHQVNDTSKYHWWELPQVSFSSQQIFCCDTKTHTHTLTHSHAHTRPHTDSQFLRCVHAGCGNTSRPRCSTACTSCQRTPWSPYPCNSQCCGW